MIRILVDSSSDYRIEEANKNGIELVSISVVIGEKTYTDGVDLDRNEFYEILEETAAFPKTSQLSPQAFLEIFEDVKDKNDEMICILLSSKLSGTYQSAVLAKNMVDYEKIYLIDSLSATYSIKVMADYACKLRLKQVSAREIVEKVEALKSKVKCIAALDTLEYLARGGRISQTVAAIGGLANVKPIITLTEEGTVGVISKCLGRNKAIHSLLLHLQQTGVHSDFPLYVIYSYGMQNCVKLEEKLEKEGIAVTERLQIGATIGTHIGPGAVGIIYVESAGN